MKQDYILKKHVRAETAAEALALDATTPVHEVHLIEDKPKETNTHAVGFHFVPVESDL